MTMRASHDAGELLTHPAILAALGTWALNDHLLKVRWPGWLSASSERPGSVAEPVPGS